MEARRPISSSSLCATALSSAAVCVRQAPQGLTDDGAHVRVGLDIEPRIERTDDRINGACGWRRLPADGRLSERIRRFGAHFGQWMFQRWQNVRDEGGPLEAAERADGDERGVRVAAVDAGADDGQVARRGRAPIFRLQNRQPP